MMIVVRGDLPEAAQDLCVKRVAEKVPIGLIEKLYLDVDGDGVNISYTLRRISEKRKMTGAVIGEPGEWNAAKQAELRDTVPNPV